MEHLHHFELSEDPFRADALEKFDVALASQQDALARLDRGVRQGKGLLLLVGGVGAGKTRVARRLYEGLEEEVFEAGMMVVLRRKVGTDWLLSRFAVQLGVEAPEPDREALIAQIYERLAIIHEDGRRAVLIIDDAHGLANADTLSEVCGLVKLEYEDRRLLTIVLVGAQALDAAMRADPLLSHNVDVRVEMPPLSREEAAHYLGARVRAAGGEPKLVLPGASAALHELAEGAPGRLNVLADNALYEAWREQRNELTRADVEAAWRALGWAGAVESAEPEPAAAVRAPARAAAAPAARGRRSPPTAVQAERTMMSFEEPAERMDFDVDTPERGVKAPRQGRGPLAEATRVELRDADLDAPPKGELDEVDDLFMELLDD